MFYSKAILCLNIYKHYYSFSFPKIIATPYNRSLKVCEKILNLKPKMSVDPTLHIPKEFFCLNKTTSMVYC